MSTTFSFMVKQIISEGSKDAIPNPAQSGYLCMPREFLSELIRLASMMQVMKIGVGSEIADIKNKLEIANQSPVITKSDDRLYNLMEGAIHRITRVCRLEGELAQSRGERELSETYAWTIAGCKLFLEYTESIE
ncbi:hypothetical protein J8L88_11110 [Aquimarina sp. MMG015]|uniref:hypothetical protein n=1 Tax=Aquimarina TaxID=290174 RepID=UPI0003FEEC28|nr:MULTISPECIES: hypothetical protein [Aquimarina]AXT56487.1 hypothetical protein D1815_12195 [Aquimarina sp. AD1]MBQ4803398.1 hypothetical protein [Aquimarina sp. MMG015]RKN23496.1 hypothetical protein D7035_11430 [Aquimarina sp. AD1]